MKLLLSNVLPLKVLSL